MPVDELSAAQLFKPVPLAARLTAGIASVKQFILRQREIIAENSVASTNTPARPPEARVNQLSNSGLLSIGFTSKLAVSDDIRHLATTNKITVYAVKEATDDDRMGFVTPVV